MHTQSAHEQKVGALIGNATYPVSGSSQMTLPEQITTLETAVLQLGEKLAAANKRASNAEASAERQAVLKAVEICASQGVTVPVSADTAGVNTRPGAGLTGLARVRAAFAAAIQSNLLTEEKR